MMQRKQKNVGNDGLREQAAPGGIPKRGGMVANNHEDCVPPEFPQCELRDRFVHVGHELIPGTERRVRHKRQSGLARRRVRKICRNRYRQMRVQRHPVNEKRLAVVRLQPLADPFGKIGITDAREGARALWKPGPHEIRSEVLLIEAHALVPVRAIEEVPAHSMQRNTVISEF